MMVEERKISEETAEVLETCKKRCLAFSKRLEKFAEENGVHLIVRITLATPTQENGNG